MRARLLLPSLLVLAAGCAQREAYYRPVEGRPLGRDGLVGVRLRVPPEAADNEATAVAALSPLVRSERDGRRAELGAVVELRNKRQETITFLPESVALADDAGRSFRPAALTRNGRRVEGPVDVGYWHEAVFVARFELDAESAFRARHWSLTWSCRIGDADRPQTARFAACGPELARRSLSGDGAGLATGRSGSSASGVPLLMDLPFLGVLFRSSSSGGSSTREWAGSGMAAPPVGGVPGQWWPLE